MTTLTLAHRSAAAATKHRPAGSLVQPSFHLRRRQTALAAQILPGSTPDKQIYICNGKPIEVNINPVQRMPMAAQFGVFCAWMGGMAVGAYLLATRTNMQWAHTAAAHITLVALFIGVGTAHFVPFFHHAMCTMIPIQGAWGFWNVPGSDRFHVWWSGVAEVAGGLGLLLGKMPAIQEAFPWLYRLSAACLMVLAIAVTPANIFLATHSAPGPFYGWTIPLWLHMSRNVLQPVLWAALWAAAGL